MSQILSPAYVTTLEPKPDVRTGRHVVHHLHVHLGFVTKYRRKGIDGRHADPL